MHLLPNTIQIFYFITPRKSSIRRNIQILCTTKKLIKLKIITYKIDTFFLLLQNYFTLTEEAVLDLSMTSAMKLKDSYSLEGKL